MPIKKSAVFSLLLAISSVSALIFTSYTPKTTDPANSKKQLPQPVKCSQYNNTNVPLPWNIVTGNLFQLEV